MNQQAIRRRCRAAAIILGLIALPAAASRPAHAIPDIPSAPSGLTATAGLTQVTLNWTASSDSFTVVYYVYRGTTSGGENYSLPISGGVSGTTYTDTGITGGPYYYTVEAYNDESSDPSNEASATPEPPIAPVARNDSYVVGENQSLVVGAPGVLGNDADAMGDPLTPIVVRGPAHGSLTLNGDGSFTYTPTEGFLCTDTFTYRDQDAIFPSTFSNVATVTITVYQFSSLCSFTGADGANPYAGLTRGPGGDYYGVNSAGGADGSGTVFKVTTAGVVTTLYSFSGGGDGGDPEAQLVLVDGNLYGTTNEGGANYEGTIFKITPSGTLTMLYPYGGSDLILGADGDLYGTTYEGGVNYAGSIFKIALNGTGYTTLYSFTGSGPDGGNPKAGLTLGANGDYYGTTYNALTGGTVFRMTPAGVLTTLHTFNGLDGGFALGRLVEGSAGQFYGASAGGGSAESWEGDGLVFELTAGNFLSSRHTFGGADGAQPWAGLTLGSDSNLYGATSMGGAHDDGIVFRLDPSTQSFATIYSFGGTDGAVPLGALTQGPDGSLYGTTVAGGAGSGPAPGAGTVYKLDLCLPPPPIQCVTAPTAPIGVIAVTNGGTASTVAIPTPITTTEVSQ